MSLQTPSNDQHQQIMMLLPWYINQSLADSEYQQVDNHVRSCRLCNGELLALRKLSNAVNQYSDLETAAEVSFAHFQSKYKSKMTGRQKPPPGAKSQQVVPFLKSVGFSGLLSGQATSKNKRVRLFDNSKLIGMAIAASLLLAITPLTIREFRSPGNADFYALSTAKPEYSAGPKLRVVFAKSLAEDGVDQLLKQIGGQRIDGPNSVGAYLVNLNAGKDSQDLTAAIAFLRSQSDVLLAEPVQQP